MSEPLQYSNTTYRIDSTKSPVTQKQEGVVWWVKGEQGRGGGGEKKAGGGGGGGGGGRRGRRRRGKMSDYENKMND